MNIVIGMALFGNKKKKHSIDSSMDPEQNKAEKNKVPEKKKAEKRRSKSQFTLAERLDTVRENCDLFADSNKQIEEAKIEYQAVTSYLTDMQKIDRIPLEDRETIEDSARKIINLTKERSKFQKRNVTITEQQYKLFEQFEMQIPTELPKIKDGEMYQALIQSDMKRLEKEKRSIVREEKDVVSRQGFLKGIAITISMVAVILFCIFVILEKKTGTSLIIPFMLTIVMAMAAALYIFLEARKNRYDIKLVEIKLNKVIVLMNKIKIKEVNNRNFLEYVYSKYQINSYQEFIKLWEEYIKVKDETKRYQTNTELLDFYHNELIGELRKNGVIDSEVWIYQPNAILDSKEMVEVRHRLNVRRQKLRERIDLNNLQKRECLKAIQNIMVQYPENLEDINTVLNKYRIVLSDFELEKEEIKDDLMEDYD